MKMDPEDYDMFWTGITSLETDPWKFLVGKVINLPVPQNIGNI
jgi:hypothetical protein